MSSKFVNRNCLVEALYIHKDISALEVFKFTGTNLVTFDANSVYIVIDDDHDVRVNYGDRLIKDCKGNLYAMPSEAFESQFISITESNNNGIIVVRWRGDNVNELQDVMHGMVSVVSVRSDLTAVLSNGITVRKGYFLVHNTNNGSWFTISAQDYFTIFGGN